MKNKFLLAALALPAILALNFQLSTCLAQGTAFTYQGRLNDGGNPATGTYDLQFTAYDSLSGGTLIAGPLIKSATGTTNGLFTVTLDFGGIFTGANRFLEIAVRTNGAPLFAILSPRQQLTPAPYTITAENLNGVVGSSGLAGTYSNVVIANNSGDQFAGDFFGTFSGINEGGLLNLNASQLTTGTMPDARLSSNIARTSQVWLIGGNAGTSSDFIGTLDDQPFDVRVNNVRAMRYRLNVDAAGNNFSNAPNVVGGYSANSVSAGVVGATIAGGGGHNDLNSNIEANKVSANFCTICGGLSNTCSGYPGTVAGGYNNTCSSNETTIAGGRDNISSFGEATIGGGTHNRCSGGNATIGGGFQNTCSGWDADVAGGGYNFTSGIESSSFVGGGEYNVSSVDLATVPGGFANAATAEFSFAAGTFAKADNIGAFVWADSSQFDFHSINRDQFCVRCTGGAKFVTAIDNTGAQTAGVRLLAGDNAWSSISDRNAKKNFKQVNVVNILEKLVAVPVQSWNYKWETDSDTPHLGPMAQDFKAAFYPGRDDKSINTMEFDGVELAAIQGFNEKLTEEFKVKETELNDLRLRLARLEKAISSNTIQH